MFWAQKALWQIGKISFHHNNSQNSCSSAATSCSPWPNYPNSLTSASQLQYKYDLWLSVPINHLKSRTNRTNLANTRKCRQIPEIGDFVLKAFGLPRQRLDRKCVIIDKQMLEIYLVVEWFFLFSWFCSILLNTQ